MSQMDREPIVIPEGSVPIGAGEVTAITDESVEVSEDTKSSIMGFISVGHGAEEVYRILEEAYRRGPQTMLFRMDKNPDTEQVVRTPISLGEARNVLEAGTSKNPGLVDLVVIEQKKLKLDHEMVPDGTQVGDKLGIWVDPNVHAPREASDGLPLMVGRISITAVVTLPSVSVRTELA